MKLNKHNKEAIVREAINDTFKARHAACRAESNELAMLVYDILYPPEVQALMDKLPNEFFYTTTIMFVHGLDVTNTDSGRSNLVELYLIDNRKVSAIDHSKWRTPLFGAEPGKDDLSDRILAHAMEHNKLRDDKTKLREQLELFLKGINSTERLQQVWPEGLPYYEDLLNIPTPNLPAVTAASVIVMMEQMTTPSAATEPEPSEGQKIRAARKASKAA